MNGVTVPTRIIMAGTSTMKLNDRFSNLPAPKRVATQAFRRIRRSSVGSQDTYPELECDEDLILADEMMDDDVEEVPVRTRIVRNPRNVTRRGRIGRNVSVRSRPIAKHVPIENRLTVVPQPKIIYVPVPVSRRGFNRGRGYQGGYSRPNNYVRQNNSFNNNNFGHRRGGQQRFAQNNFQQQRFTNYNRGFNRGGRGRGRGFVQMNQRQGQGQPKKTLEQLDRELDEYMNAKNSKHPRIIV